MQQENDPKHTSHNFNSLLNTFCQPPFYFILFSLPQNAFFCICVFIYLCVCVFVSKFMPHSSQVYFQSLETKKHLFLWCPMVYSYRVELLITDNPAASHFLLSHHVTHTYSFILSLFPLSLHLIPLSPFLIVSLVFCLLNFLFSLSLFSSSQFLQESYHLLGGFSWSSFVCESSPCRHCQWCGSEPSGPSKADYELILAKEAGNSLKHTKLFH